MPDARTVVPGCLGGDLIMSGRYLYCQNTSCGVYLGCSGADSCSICGWVAGRDMNDEEE